MTLGTLSRYLLKERNRQSLSTAELRRREVALAELQDFIFVNDTRAYLEHSVRARLGLAYIKEHWGEIMAELQSGLRKQ
jgi:hypothetical protein